MAASLSLNSPLRVACLGSHPVPGAPTSVGRKGLSRQRAVAAGRWGPWNRRGLRQRSSLTARQSHGPRSRRPCSRGRTRRTTSTCWKEDTASAPSSRRQAPQQPRRLSALPRRAATPRVQSLWISPRTRKRGSKKAREDVRAHERVLGLAHEPQGQARGKLGGPREVRHEAERAGRRAWGP